MAQPPVRVLILLDGDNVAVRPPLRLLLPFALSSLSLV